MSNLRELVHRNAVMDLPTFLTVERARLAWFEENALPDTLTWQEWMDDYELATTQLNHEKDPTEKGPGA